MTEHVSYPAEGQSNEAPLESWKEIANYVNRTVRTVKRWEKSEGLPVHRHLHQARSSVYAYPSELDAWRERRKPGAGPLTGWLGLAPVRALAATATLVLALMTVGSGPILTPVGAIAGESTDAVVIRQIEFEDLAKTPIARLSPDGKKMVYVHVQDKKPRFSICVMDLASGEDQPLVEGVGATNFFAWSPDGGKIVYMHGRGELRVMSASGGEPAMLWSSPDSKASVRPLDWSRDGRHILVTVSSLADWTTRLAILPADGGAPRYVVSGAFDDMGDVGRFSPDGKFLVGFLRKGKNTDVFVWAVDGSREVRVTRHPSKDTYPFWSPDGRHIVFTSERAKTHDLWAVRMRGAAPAGAPVRIKTLGRNKRLTGFTVSGQLTMLVTGEGTIHDLFVLPVSSSTGESQGEFVPFAKHPTQHAFPRWSPDGSRVAYTSRKGNIGWPRIFVSSGNREEDQEIPVRDYYAVNIEWMPDGKHLIFPGWQADGRVGIFRVSLEDEEIKPLHLGDRLGPGFKGGFVNLWWLPRARKFMFSKLFRGPDGMEIFTMDSRGKKIQSLAQTIPSRYWVWPSPDGRHVAYREGQSLKLWSLSEQTSMTTLAEFPEGKQVEGPAWSSDGSRVAWKDKQKLKVLFLADSTQKVLVEVNEALEIGVDHWAGAMAWSPDGKEIAYLLRDKSADKSDPAELWVVPAAGGPPRRIARAPVSHPQLRELKWHPNGKAIYARGAAPDTPGGGYQHWVLENFLPKPEVAQTEN